MVETNEQLRSSTSDDASPAVHKSWWVFHGISWFSTPLFHLSTSDPQGGVPRVSRPIDRGVVHGGTSPWITLQGFGAERFWTCDTAPRSIVGGAVGLAGMGFRISSAGG
jgi:hypothetical protein